MNQSENESHISFEATNHDILGLKRLFEGTNCGISVDTDLIIKTNDVVISAEEEGSSVARLMGDRVFQLILPIEDMRHARAIIDPFIDVINGLGRGYDPSFQGIEAVGATIIDGGISKYVILPVYSAPKSGSTLGCHANQVASLEARLNLIEADDDVRFVVETLAEKPTWNGIGAAFETMRHALNVKKLSDAKIMTSEQEKEFGKAANNLTDRAEGARHGKTKSNQNLPFNELIKLMTLNEAIELHRQAVNRYLDTMTGHKTAYEICDWMNDKPRFGLHGYKRL